MDDKIDIAYTMHYFNNMNILWDEEKNKRLMAERFISFEEITGLLLSKSYLDIIENPSRDGQMCFILIIQGYTWVVLFLIDDQNRIIIKTAFPSRKFHKRYGGRK